MSQTAEDARIRSLRPPKEKIDAWHAIGVQRERERCCVPVLGDPAEREEGGSGGDTAPFVTIFLAGSECPFTCLYCDLWRYTLEEETPEGAIPAQIEEVLGELGPLPPGCRVKLYNASNFFDRRAVPRADLPRIAELLEGFERVVVECHPKLVGQSLFDFDTMIDGRLEVAMGLETVHPESLARLNKRMSKEDYDSACEALASRGIPHRAFVLIGAPFVPARDTVDWAVVSAAYAIKRGAETVTLIPVRGGNGELERLAAQGLFRMPTLSEIESAIERSLALPGDAVIQIDLWDLENFSTCSECFTERTARLVKVNLTGVVAPRVVCRSCMRTG